MEKMPSGNTENVKKNLPQNSREVAEPTNMDKIGEEQALRTKRAKEHQEMEKRHGEEYLKAFDAGEDLAALEAKFRDEEKALDNKYARLEAEQKAKYEKGAAVAKAETPEQKSE